MRENIRRLLCFGLLTVAATALGADKKIVFIAGGPSHGPGKHEHRAGCLLLQRCLDEVPGVRSVVVPNWTANADFLTGASAVVIFSDGGNQHPILQGDRLPALDKLMRQGAGFGALHYAVIVPRDHGGPEFLRWMGGYYETNWSVNPFWEADFKDLPEHPVTRGVAPFKFYDEWYFHMRYVDGMKGVTPILSAHPPQSALSRPDGPHSGNPFVREAVRRGEIQHVMWVYERPDGGRGFGFTGGHDHQYWGNENFRKVVLNAILWIARVEVPPGGVVSRVTSEDLKQNLDPKK